MPRTSRRIVLALGVVAALLLAGCAGEGDDDPNRITVWSADTLPDRVAATQSIIDRFTRQTGIRVELVTVDDDQFNQLLTSAAAAGNLPDVVGSQSLVAIRTLATNGLTDTAANAAVVEALGADTFDRRALELTRDGNEQLAVPSEAWSQLLYYRKDLFAAAGLQPPTTYAEILTAARTLQQRGVAGFAGATAPGDAFTQQTFEHLALANGCQMVDDAGQITLDGLPCVEAFAFYQDLITHYSVPGAQDVDSVRATYFAGQAGMAIWSTFLLDELAGLRNDALPTCPQCAGDPRFLARNTGVVAAVRGPSGTAPAQFGEVTSWAIPVDANAEAAGRFVRFMMGDGYVDWLAIAPEGKYPVRTGSTPGGTNFADAWEGLPVGVDTEAPLAQLYPQDVLDVLSTGPDSFSRWAITQGQGDLLGASLGELPVPAAVAAVTGGGATPQAAAQQAASALRTIQDQLG